MTKHIDIQHYFIHALVEENMMSLEHVPTEKQLADKFEALRSSLSLCVMSLY